MSPSLRALPVLCLCAACGLLTAGCAVANFMHEKPGTPVSRLQPGLGRAEVNQLLGAPLREWRPNDRVVYCLYPYERPMGADLSAAGGALFMDVLTLGLFEGIEAIVPHTPGRDNDMAKRHASVARLWFSFDAQARLLGVFPEMAVLPEDGLPVKAPAPAVR